jgi:DNA invertase Pin-like site-specific DNA recombinase
MSSGVLWIRVSSEPQSHGYSLDAQERLLEEVAAKHNIPITKKFKVAESAKASEARKNFHEMVGFIETNEITHLIVYSTSRLARNYKDFYTIQKLIDERNLTVLVQSDNKIINRSSLPHDRFVFRLMGDLAQLDNEQKGQWTKDGLMEKVRSGGMAGLAPEGYLNTFDPNDPEPDPKKKRRTVVLENEDKVALIRLAFELYAEGGWTIDTVTKELNRRGLRTKSTSRRPDAPITWHAMQLMLKNPAYFGYNEYKGELYLGKHKPIITKQLFDQVQMRLKENCYCPQSHQGKFFAFKKFLKCGYCGSSIKAWNAYGDGKTRNYYACNRGHCEQGTYAEPEIDNLFAEVMSDFYIDEALAEKIREQLKETHADSVAFERRELKRLHTIYNRKKEHLNKLYTDRLDDVITVDMYKERQVEIQGELKTIEEQIENLGKHNLKFKEEGSQILELLNGFKKIYVSQDLRGRAKILAVLLDKCIIRGSKSGNHTGSKIDKEDTEFLWKQPFDTLFKMGRLSKEYNHVRRSGVKGE